MNPYLIPMYNVNNDYRVTITISGSASLRHAFGFYPPTAGLMDKLMFRSTTSTAGLVVTATIHLPGQYPTIGTQIASAQITLPYNGAWVKMPLPATGLNVTPNDLYYIVITRPSTADTVSFETKGSGELVGYTTEYNTRVWAVDASNNLVSGSSVIYRPHYIARINGKHYGDFGIGGTDTNAPILFQVYKLPFYVRVFGFYIHEMSGATLNTFAADVLLCNLEPNTLTVDYRNPLEVIRLDSLVLPQRTSYEVEWCGTFSQPRLLQYFALGIRVIGRYGAMRAANQRGGMAASILARRHVYMAYGVRQYSGGNIYYGYSTGDFGNLRMTVLVDPMQSTGTGINGSVLPCVVML
jgi:hypothetical protein